MFINSSESIPLSNPRKMRVSVDCETDHLANVKIPNETIFSENNVVDTRTHILQCHLKTSRARLKVLLGQIYFLAGREEIEPKKSVAMALELLSNEEKDHDTSNVCKGIVKTG